MPRDGNGFDGRALDRWLDRVGQDGDPVRGWPRLADSGEADEDDTTGKDDDQ